MRWHCRDLSWLCCALLSCTRAPVPSQLSAAEGGATRTGAPTGGTLSSAAAAASAAVSNAPAAGSGGAPDFGAYDGPRLLSQTGLYSDTAQHALAPGVIPYQPLGQLWSDAADKQRWVLLPAGAVIDTSDMDVWRYPIGTKVWKEFAKAGVRLETRLLEKLPDGQWRMIAFAWDAAQREATAVPKGVINASGTEHDIPDTDQCTQCHEGRPDRLLGVSALQLAHPAAGMTLERLLAEGKLSAPPAQPLRLPGDAVERAALAYLHANCGHCHYPARKRAEREISVYFWQETKALASVRDTVTYTSLVKTKSLPLWIEAIPSRMQNRGGLQQMPPLATKAIDHAGIAAVNAWLDRLRAEFQPSAALPPVAPTARCNGVEKVFAIFERAACRSAFCHGAGTGELDFTTPEQLHASMVGVTAVGEGCKDVPLPRVQPGDPRHSLLLLKLEPGPPCGKIMPPAALQALTPADIQAVSDWIAGCTL